MYPSSTLCLLAGLSLSSLVSASPLGLDIVKPRLVDVGRECTNRPPFQAVCWDALRIPEYYKNWTESNRGACDDQAIYLNDAVCFIRLVTGKTFFCNETGLTDAEEIELCGINYPMLEQLSAQEAYVLRAIYGVWKWFSSITKALTDAPPAITAGVQVIADQFEPLPQPLSLTPTFLYRSVMAGVIDISFPASNLDIAHAYGQANQLQTPANSISWDLSEFFNPLNGFPGKENVYEWDQSTPFNGSLLLENRYILNQGLHTILRFYQKFLAVNDKGSFMEDGNAPNANTTNLFQPFYAYIFNYFIRSDPTAKSNDNRIIVAVSRDTDPYLFHQNNHDSAYPIACDYYEAGGICSAWYHSNTTNTTYALVNSSPHKSSHNYYAAMSAIISQNKVLSGDDIFANLDWCRDRNKKPRTEVVLTPQGGTIDCLLYYNVAFSVFSPTCDAKDCEFEGEEGFSSPDWSRDNCFPTAYLGYRRSDKKMKPC